VNAGSVRCACVVAQAVLRNPTAKSTSRKPCLSIILIVGLGWETDTRTARKIAGKGKETDTKEEEADTRSEQRMTDTTAKGMMTQKLSKVATISTVHGGSGDTENSHRFWQI
jgi:hypothetical protein